MVVMMVVQRDQTMVVMMVDKRVQMKVVRTAMIVAARMAAMMVVLMAA